MNGDCRLPLRRGADVQWSEYAQALIHPHAETSPPCGTWVERRRDEKLIHNLREKIMIIHST
jgi:hypothetical protein